MHCFFQHEATTGGSGAAYDTDEKRLWPGDVCGCLDHQRNAETLKKIGFEGGCCVVEVFRPDYYKLSQKENVRTASDVTKAHVKKYWQFKQVTTLKRSVSVIYKVETGLFMI